jgi:hypothetical protein
MGIMKKLINIDEAIWKRFERVAVAEFGLYGAITKGIDEAVKMWIQKEEEKKR